MNNTAKFCLLYLLIWHQTNGSSISSVTFEKTSLNLSPLKNVQYRLVADSASPISCAVECSLESACHGFGYRISPNKECLLIMTTESNETYHFTFEGFEYYLMEGLPSHCGQVLNNESGLTLLDIGNGQLVVAFCDGGGWLVLQQRLDGSENFYRNWADYKSGFGKPWSEFWIGNENLHHLTKDGNSKLLIQLEDKTGDKYDAKYTNFSVESEAMNYKLEVAGYEGGDPPGDSFEYNNGKYFTTFDRDNDLYNSNNCAAIYKSAWWYGHCTHTNLNGNHGSDDYGMGITWFHWKGFHYSLSRVRMLLKKKQEI